MALPVIADTLRVSVEGRMPNGHTWANVLHFRKSGALTFAGAIAVLDPILTPLYSGNAAGTPGWRYNASSAASVVQIRYLPLDGVSAFTVIAHAFNGANAGDPLPANVALVITLRTALRGRAHRGRCYWGGFEESSNTTGGVPTAGVVANVATVWGQLLTNLVASGVSLVVASYLHSSAENVTSLNVDSRWDTQRRRLNL
jgi:hypothetical protein